MTSGDVACRDVTSRALVDFLRNDKWGVVGRDVASKALVDFLRNDKWDAAGRDVASRALVDFCKIANYEPFLRQIPSSIQQFLLPVFRITNILLHYTSRSRAMNNFHPVFIITHHHCHM